ncbi:hypothetical protein K3369_29460 [Pseudomonas mandelii]|uniref:hypothetical protein n=1 Tax=Pseudomonas mandelii TaxID=75612 RepID=UPI001C83F215|nr:hypothetical protein [Pseudomonas mandelii]QZA97786.1 hypothetical protein K3369_29460 [Pseudomonas mandelii]
MGKPRAEIESHNDSIRARKILLEDILANLKEYVSNEVVLAALKNQGALASLSYEYNLADRSYSIAPTSLNTLKRKSDELLGHHGFAGLERLRGLAKDSIAAYVERESRPTKKTKHGLEQINKDLEASLNSLRRANFRLLQGLSSALSSIKEVRDASSEAVRNKRSTVAINSLLVIVSMNESPFDVIPSRDNVSSFKVVGDE